MSAYNDFIDYLLHEKRYSIHTVQAYQTDLEQFFLFQRSTYGQQDAEKANHLQIRSWLASLKEDGMHTRSINRKISTLKSFYRFLLKNQRIDISPMSKIISPKNAKRLPAFIHEQQMDSLLNNIEFPDSFKGKTDKLILELLYQTGMRRAELLGLKISSVQWYARAIKVLGKGNKERIIPISPYLIQALKQYIDVRLQQADSGHDTLLILENGKPLYPRYVYQVVKHYLSLITTSDKRSPHILRHTFATHLLNQGADLNAVKELLGHANLTATQIYTHNTIEKLQEAHRKAHPRE